MGVVYKAEDVLLKRTVALKFLLPTLTTDLEAKERFVHEAQAASALEHANICSIHEIGEHDGQTFIVMGYHEGESLNKKIERGPFDVEDAVDTTAQVALGLAKAHEAGIVHRDIKPANIIVTKDDVVKILDFGLAKVAGTTLLTKTGTTLGTAAYMSPEQARGEQVDQRTDIWSLGVVLFEMLTGRLPFKSDHEQALVYAILNENPKPVRALRPEVPEAVEQIVTKALAKKPQERYQTARELLSDLRLTWGAESTGSTIAATETLQRKKRKRLVKGSVISMAAVAVILLGLLVVWPMVQERLLASSPMTIAVISFENQTGDKTQDHLRAVLQDAIITSLEQSKYIRVTTRQRMADILKQMGKSPEYVDNELGLEICRRESARLMAVGTFASAGELYRTTLKLVDVNTLETKQTYSASGKGAESLLEKQIDDLSREVSRGIGVSERQTLEIIRPVAEITTTSLDAYQLYLRAWQEWDNFYIADARRFMELAVQKDSLFAAAWDALSKLREDPKGVEEATRRARSLAWKASERERYHMAEYADSSVRATLLGVHGLSDLEFVKLCVERFPEDKEFLFNLAMHLWRIDLEEAIATLTRAVELDPTYGLALANLPYMYQEKGEWEKSIEMLKRYASAAPGEANPYDSMGDIYLERRMYNEAIASFKQALAVKPNWYFSADKIMMYNLVMEDYEGSLQWSDTSAARGTNPGNQARQTWERALIAFWRGRLNETERLLAWLNAIRAKAGMQVGRLPDFLDIWVACERGQFGRSRRALDSWGGQYIEQGSARRHSIREMFVQLCRGFIDLAAGEADSVAVRLSAMDGVRARIPPSDTTALASMVISSYQAFSGTLRSEWLLETGRTREAMAAVPRDEPARLASGPVYAPTPAILPGVKEYLPHWYFLPVMVDILPRAYLSLGQLDSAIASYERAVDHGTREWPIFPRYHYRLAQLYDRKGMKAKAITEYERFLKIWGKADPIYKEPADARARLARLKRV